MIATFYDNDFSKMGTFSWFIFIIVSAANRSEQLFRNNKNKKNSLTGMFSVIPHNYIYITHLNDQRS